MPAPGGDNQERLVAAALELFEERGYAGTTVAAIAERAGVGRRTFFRHFEDKQEVLFTRTGRIEQLWTSTAAQAADPVEPLDVVTQALSATATLFADRHGSSARRQATIAATPELRERELTKLARLADITALALQARGVAPAAATVAAEIGALVLRIAYERWTATFDGVALGDHMAAVMAQLGDALTDVAHRDLGSGA